MPTLICRKKNVGKWKLYCLSIQRLFINEKLLSIQDLKAK